MAKRTVRPLTLIEVEYIAHRLAQELMDYGEPIPAFSTRYPDILESCLKTPFQKFSNQSLYPGIHLKAAVLFYLMVKNHPFKNGNKRVAVITLLYFLNQNGRVMNASDIELYEFAKSIAESDPSAENGKMDMVVDQVLRFFDDYVAVSVVSEGGDEVVDDIAETV